MTRRPVIYQLVVRLFGNLNETRKPDGTLEENGCGKLADIDSKALASLRDLGVTHVWLTGILRQATLTDHSEIGLRADNPNVVKGRAGSFYAVRDYYDVSPDYAVVAQRRLEELDRLIDRIHAAGLFALIDLVPNHVARCYGSVIHPERDFGRNDDASVFFSPRNDYFYLVEPAGQSLRLRKPDRWNPEGVVFDGTFEPESGGAGRVPRVTGNNVTSPSPSADDWYETVKLNYGFNFVDGSTAFDPIPSVWTKIDEVLAYWQARGVDGFRCDFAHYVPEAAWRYLIESVKRRDPGALVIGEAYEKEDELSSTGFDALYDFETYNLLKRMYLGQASATDLANRFDAFDEKARRAHVDYLENHDERRIASPLVPGASIGETGFGSTQAGRQLLPVVYLHGSGPVLVYNGQEVGERGEGASGFSGDDGRTTIFDYGSMPELQKWVNGHAYDGGRLDPDQRALRQYHADLLRLCQDPAVRGDGYARLGSEEGGLFIFARFAEGVERLLIVAANFAQGRAATTTIRIPRALADRAKISDQALYEALLVLGGPAPNEALARPLGSALVERGFSVSVPDQTTFVIRIERAAP